MKRALLPPLLLLLLPAFGLGAQSDPSSVFSGMGASLGRYPRVTARLTFDPKKAAQGGLIFAAERATSRNEEAIRVSEAVITTSGGRLSRAASVARAHGVPALIIRRGRWRSGPVLELEVPVFGAVRPGASGSRHHFIEASKTRALAEGEVVTVDAAQGLLLLYPPDEQQRELDLADAVRAFEGLRDAQALLHWFENRADERGAAVAARLEEELAPRVLAGGVRPDDFSTVSGGIRKALTEADAREAAAAGRALLVRLAADESDEIGGAAEEMKAAGTENAARRISEGAAARWERLSALALALGSPQSVRRLSGSRAAFVRLAQSRLSSLRGKAGDWRDAAAAAGASMPKSARLGPDPYRRFLDSGGLEPLIEDLSGNASLDLRLKSERIRGLFEAVKLEPESELGREIAAAAPPGSFLNVVTTEESQHFVPRAKLLGAVKRAWASYWNAAPLGARKRRGETVVPEVLIEAVAAADASGVVFSRDPASPRGERAVVEAVWGEAEGLERGEVPPDEFSLDRRSGRGALPALIGEKRERFMFDPVSGSVKSESVPPGLATRPCLSAGALADAARVARALESHFGSPVEARFSVSRGRIQVLSVKPIPGPEVVVLPPAAPAPSPAPDVEPVRSLR